MKYAYADPPYLGCGKLYKKNHDEAHIWDRLEAHQKLIERLADYDGWAMSLSAPSLRHILPLCPDDVRIAAWVKPFATFKKGVNPIYAWEPVLFRGVRKRGLEEPHIKDWVSENITMQKGLPGAKPLRFCIWLCELLGVQPGDSLDDLFPGTCVMTEAVERLTTGRWQQAPLFDQTKRNKQ